MTNHPNRSRSINDFYASGLVAGMNAASGQGPRNEPSPGRTKRSQAYYEGWHRGYTEERQMIDDQNAAIRRTRNP